MWWRYILTYDDFIVGKGVDHGKVCFFNRWVELYKVYIKKSGKDDIAGFLSSIESQYKDWQVLQARKAVNFFIMYKKDKLIPNKMAWDEVL